MTRSKKIFLLAVTVFIVLLIYVSYDISRRTSFPGSKPQLQERLKQKYLSNDSVLLDSGKSSKDQKF
jgi:hypothetical protein